MRKCFLKDHLFGLWCHYFSREGGYPRRTTLSLCHIVTIGLGRVGVRGNMDNVTKYDVFFLKASLNVNFKWFVQFTTKQFILQKKSKFYFGLVAIVIICHTFFVHWLSRSPPMVLKIFSGLQKDTSLKNIFWVWRNNHTISKILQIIDTWYGHQEGRGEASWQR